VVGGFPLQELLILKVSAKHSSSSSSSSSSSNSFTPCGAQGIHEELPSRENCNPEGYRRRGRPKRMWRRTIEDEIRNIRISWNEVKRIAKRN